MKINTFFTTPTPVLDMVRKYAADKPYRFHTPGHKGIIGYHDFFRLDMTELLFSDTLHNPKGAILEGEKLAAEFYGSLRTHFLVNGASSGVIGALLGLKELTGGGRLIMARHSHKSVYNGCMLAGIEPIIIDNESVGDVNVPLSAHQIEEAIGNNPDALGVFVTHPNYYGMCRDILAIEKVVRKHGKFFLVDQAHGAHYAASGLLPVSASGIADACIDSAHKTLPALTQAAFLNVNNAELDTAISSCLNVVNSTSPSYLLMASLDYARAYTADNAGKYRELKVMLDKLKAKHRGMFINNDDFTRLVLDVSSLRISGRTAERYFNGINIYPEFADSRYCVFIISLADTERTIKAISDGITKLSECDWESERAFTARRVSGIRQTRFTSIAGCDTEMIPFQESEGRICCNEVGFFPPCLPILVRGEQITREIIDYVSANIDNTFGLYGDKITVVK